jgi:hypothetical protein
LNVEPYDDEVLEDGRAELDDARTHWAPRTFALERPA